MSFLIGWLRCRRRPVVEVSWGHERAAKRARLEALLQEIAERRG